MSFLSRGRAGISRWWPVCWRVLLAVLGGYGLAALASVLATFLPGPQSGGVITGGLISFLVYCAIVIAVFCIWRAYGTNRTARVPGVRQRMTGLHTWAGLLAGWILYAMFLTGSLSFFREEISHWMQPQSHAVQADIPATSQALEQALAVVRQKAPAVQRVSIDMPAERNAVMQVSWRDPAVRGRGGFQRLSLNPTSGEPLQERATAGGDFLYGLHFNLHYVPPIWGRWISGICAMFMLIAIVSGIITHKKILTDFFTFRSGKGMRSWMDAHNALSVLGLPFHLMITYSGLITLMLLYMPWGANAAYDTPADRREMYAEFGAAPQVDTASGMPAVMAPLDVIFKSAQAHWPAADTGRITLANIGDANARVIMTRSERAQVSVSPQHLIFDGVTGELVEERKQGSRAAAVRNIIYGLHLGRFADIMTRWLYFLVSLAGTAMVATGLILWVSKRATKKGGKEVPGWNIRLIEKINCGVVAGLSLAVAAYFWANRLLPASLGDRANLETQTFFLVWCAAGIYAGVRPAARAWIELFILTAVLLILLPFSGLLLDTGASALDRMMGQNRILLGFNLTVVGFGVLHLFMARRVWRSTIKAISVVPRKKRANDGLLA